SKVRIHHRVWDGPLEGEPRHSLVECHRSGVAGLGWLLHGPRVCHAHGPNLRCSKGYLSPALRTPRGTTRPRTVHEETRQLAVHRHPEKSSASPPFSCCRWSCGCLTNPSRVASTRVGSRSSTCSCKSAARRGRQR